MLNIEYVRGALLPPGGGLFPPRVRWAAGPANAVVDGGGGWGVGLLLMGDGGGAAGACPVPRQVVVFTRSILVDFFTRLLFVLIISVWDEYRVLRARSCSSSPVGFKVTVRLSLSRPSPQDKHEACLLKDFKLIMVL